MSLSFFEFVIIIVFSISIGIHIPVKVMINALVMMNMDKIVGCIGGTTNPHLHSQIDDEELIVFDYSSVDMKSVHACSV